MNSPELVGAVLPSILYLCRLRVFPCDRSVLITLVLCVRNAHVIYVFNFILTADMSGTITPQGVVCFLPELIEPFAAL